MTRFPLFLCALLAAALAGAEPIRVNFQPAASPVPAGYRVDAGAQFGVRSGGLSFGWNRATPDLRDRNSPLSPDQRYDTLIHLQKRANPEAVWEIGLPTGVYEVRVVAGDVDFADSDYRIAVEGALAIAGVPTAGNRWFEGVVRVPVDDGRLTIGNAVGARNNKLCFVEITDVSDRAIESVTRVDFQPAGRATGSGYVPDAGAVFGERGAGLSFGWNLDNQAQAIDRDSPHSPDQRFDTIVQMQAPANPDARWELAVPKGSYLVRAVAGDAERFDPIYDLTAEGATLLTGRPTSRYRFIHGSALITVTDGRLTIANGPTAAGNAIAFIDVDASFAAGAHQIGPFRWTRKAFDPAAPVPAAISRDGAVEDAVRVAGDLRSGTISTLQWLGDNAAGGRSGGGNTLFGPADRRYFISLEAFEISNGSDGAEGFVTFPRFQQDAQLRIGHVARPSLLLAQRHGSGFELGGRLDAGQIVLSLPFRLVQGGGAAWQTSSRGGIPPEAGVWQVPSGSTLAEAQADPANRLAGLAGLLGELPPDVHAAAFDFAVQADGRWRLSIDIDRDGVVDVDVTSEQFGNAPSRLPGLDALSDLIVSTLPAGGTPAGQVGRTAMVLGYREAVDAPSALLADRRPLDVSVPQSSYVSPAPIEGQRWSARQTIAAHSRGIPLGVGLLGERRFFIDLPLDADAPTSVTIDQSGIPPTTVQAAVAWRVSDLALDLRHALRTGDSLLIAFAGAYQDTRDRYLIDTDGDGAPDVERGFGETVVATFPVPGTFVVRGWHDRNQDGRLDAGDAEVGTCTVAVADVLLPEAIAAQVGRWRDVDVACAPGIDPDSLAFLAEDATQLEVRRVEISDGVARIQVRPLRRGTPRLVVRLGGSGGALLASREIDEFTLELTAAAGIVVDAATNTGMSRLIIRPHVPGLFGKASMFASRASFAGAKDLSFATDGARVVRDEATGESIAEIDLPISLPPTENTFCFDVDIVQFSSPAKLVGQIGANGCACTLEIDQIVLCHGSKEGEDLTVRIKKQGCDQIEKDIVILPGNHDVIPEFDDFPDSKRRFPEVFVCDPARPLLRQVPVMSFARRANAFLDAEVGSYTLTIGGTAFRNAVVVIPDDRLSIAPESAEICVRDKVQLSAYRCVHESGSKPEARQVRNAQWSVRSPLRIIGADVGPTVTVTADALTAIDVSGNVTVTDRDIGDSASGTVSAIVEVTGLVVADADHPERTTSAAEGRTLTICAESADGAKVLITPEFDYSQHGDKVLYRVLRGNDVVDQGHFDDGEAQAQLTPQGGARRFTVEIGCDLDRDGYFDHGSAEKRVAVLLAEITEITLTEHGTDLDPNATRNDATATSGDTLFVCGTKRPLIDYRIDHDSELAGFDLLWELRHEGAAVVTDGGDAGSVVLPDLGKDRMEFLFIAGCDLDRDGKFDHQTLQVRIVWQKKDSDLDIVSVEVDKPRISLYTDGAQVTITAVVSGTLDRGLIYELYREDPLDFAPVASRTVQDTTCTLAIPGPGKYRAKVSDPCDPVSNFRDARFTMAGFFANPGRIEFAWDTVEEHKQDWKEADSKVEKVVENADRAANAKTVLKARAEVTEANVTAMKVKVQESIAANATVRPGVAAERDAAQGEVTRLESANAELAARKDLLLAEKDALEASKAGLGTTGEDAEIRRRINQEIAAIQDEVNDIIKRLQKNSAALEIERPRLERAQAALSALDEATIRYDRNLAFLRDGLASTDVEGTVRKIIQEAEDGKLLANISRDKVRAIGQAFGAFDVPYLGLVIDAASLILFAQSWREFEEYWQNIDKLRTEYGELLKRLTFTRRQPVLSKEITVTSIPDGMVFGIREDDVVFKTKDSVFLTEPGGRHELLFGSHFFMVENDLANWNKLYLGGGRPLRIDAFGNLGSSTFRVLVGSGSEVAASVKMESTGATEDQMVAFQRAKVETNEQSLQAAKLIASAVADGLSILLGALAAVLVLLSLPGAVVVGIAAVVVSFIDLFISLFFNTEPNDVQQIRKTYPK